MAGQEWHELDEKMRQEKGGAFYLPLLSPSILQEQWAQNRAVVRPVRIPTEYRGMIVSKQSGPILAHAARRESNHPAWNELAQIYVDKEARGNGLMKEVVCELIATTMPCIRLFCITPDGSVMRLLQGLYFRPITKAVMPGVGDWAREVGLDVGDRLPQTALRTGLPDIEAGERWLFVRRA